MVAGSVGQRRKRSGGHCLMYGSKCRGKRWMLEDWKFRDGSFELAGSSQ